jgi:Lysozyme like domain
MPSTLSGTKLSIAQLVGYAQQAGFTGTGLATIVAIALAESSGWTQAQQWGPQQSGTDRGVLQINSYWHPDVSDTQAYDPAQAFQAAYRISNNGTNFSQWATYTGGAYKQYLSQVGNNVGTTAATGATSTTADTTTLGSSNPFDALGAFWTVLSSWIENPARMALFALGVMALGVAFLAAILPLVGKALNTAGKVAALA